MTQSKDSCILQARNVVLFTKLDAEDFLFSCTDGNIFLL